MIASVGQRTLGPFFARRGAGPAAAGLVAWVTAAEGSNRRVLVVPVGPNGAPRGPDTLAAYVSIDTTMLVVKPLRDPDQPGFLLAWTSLTERGKSLWSVVVGDDGAPRAKPIELTRTNDDIAWVDIVPTDRGALCLWAEETRGSDANLVAAAIGASGKVRGAPTRVAHGIVGWHALEMPGGVGVSTVDAGAQDPKGQPGRLLGEARGGALSFHKLDTEGHPTAPPVVVTNKPIVSGDVEVARDGSRLLFAWTDRSNTEPAVTIAALDDKSVTPPRRFAEARGGATLLALAGGPAGVAVMFEAPARRKGENRRVHVARVGDGLVLGSRPTSLEVVGRGQPELAATSTGFAVLATTSDCEFDSAACMNADAVATLLRMDAAGSVMQREPFTFQTDPATLGWGLTCDGDTCFSLAASPGAPSRIRTTAIRPQANTKPAPLPENVPPKDGPHIVDVTAVASGETVVDMATTELGGTRLLAMLSSGPAERGRRGADDGRPAARGRRGADDGRPAARERRGADDGRPAARERRGADDGRPAGRARHEADDGRRIGLTLSTRVIDETGTAGPPSILSTRALQVGGVAIAGTEKLDDGFAVAWVARENNDPEVHVTRIDKRGRRTNDVQLTTTKGDATDVTITWAGGGWIVAWVDGRDGNGEVYATKVSPDLTRIAREERITNAPGDASDLVALGRGDAVWLAWADARESPRDGLADIFVSAVRMRDAKRAFDEQRLLPTAAHSRTPHLAAGPSGVHVAWIEDAPIGSETPGSSGYGAFWAKLDPAGKAVERPARIPLAGEGAATSVAIQLDAGLRAVVARSTPDVVSLDAVDLSAAAPRPAPLFALDGPPSLDVRLVLDGGVLYFNDEGPLPSDRRARRARIAWSR